MRQEILQNFICPTCRSHLNFDGVSEQERDQVKEATMICKMGIHRFQISGFVPRFFLTEDTSSCFGFEWNKHPKTQLDSVNGMRLSEERFFRETNWPRDLSGQRVLEIGSGAGRFTEIALQTGAQVFSVDASRAVVANWSNNGHHPNLVLCQASLYNLPFPENHFDKVFCFGVLQFTPDVPLAFASIARFPRPGGELVVDAFNKKNWRNYHIPEYLIRPITRRLPHDRLYRWISWSVPRLLPVSTWLRNHIPLIGRQVSTLIPISNYEGILPTESRELIEQYSILDTFNTLSPKSMLTQYPDTVRQWFLDAGYENIVSQNGATFAMRGTRQRA